MDEKWFVLLIVTIGLITSLLYHPIIFLLYVASLVAIKYCLNEYMTSELTADGKWIFITGCDTGIGHALAKSLDKRGCCVIAACRDKTGNGASNLQQSSSNRLTIVSLELTSPESIDQCIQTVIKLTENNGLWAVVNNAGMHQCVNHAELVTMEMYRRTMDVNYFGMLHICKGLLPLLRTTKGRIVNVTSVQGRVPVKCFASYTPSKWAGETFSDLLRRDMKKFGIKVSIIEPGGYGLYTNIIDKSAIVRQNEEMIKHATREVIEAYGGEKYILKNKIVAKTIPESNVPEDPLAPIITQMEHALLNSSPDTRYLIGSPYFDKYCWMARISPFLPDNVSDCLAQLCNM